MISSSIEREPLAKGTISNTPWGPFQKTVDDLLMTSAFYAIDCGPISRPNHPSSIPWLLVLTSVLAFSANLSAHK